MKQEWFFGKNQTHEILKKKIKKFFNIKKYIEGIKQKIPLKLTKNLF